MCLAGRLFAFPKEEITRRLWLSAINRYADSFNPEHSVVCEFHFKAEDFEANYAPRTSTARVRVRFKLVVQFEKNTCFFFEKTCFFREKNLASKKKKKKVFFFFLFF